MSSLLSIASEGGWAVGGTGDSYLLREAVGSIASPRIVDPRGWVGVDCLPHDHARPLVCGADALHLVHFVLSKRVGLRHVPQLRRVQQVVQLPDVCRARQRATRKRERECVYVCSRCRSWQLSASQGHPLSPTGHERERERGNESAREREKEKGGEGERGRGGEGERGREMEGVRGDALCENVLAYR